MDVTSDEEIFFLFLSLSACGPQEINSKESLPTLDIFSELE